MKKVLLLLMLFVSLSYQTSFGVVYSVNIGASEDINAFGDTWEGFNSLPGTYQNYSDFSIQYNSQNTTKPTISVQSGFTGDITYDSKSLTLWKLSTGSTVTPYYLYSYSETGTPVISQFSTNYGTIGTLIDTGTVKLDGDTGIDYFYSVYQVNLGYVSTGTPYYRLGTYYTNNLNAVQLSDVYPNQVPVPEPTTLLLLGVGAAFTQKIRKKRNSLVS